MREVKKEEFKYIKEPLIEDYKTMTRKCIKALVSYAPQDKRKTK